MFRYLLLKDEFDLFQVSLEISEFGRNINEANFKPRQSPNIRSKSNRR